MPTRCFMPPESSLGYADSKPLQPYRVESAQGAMMALEMCHATRQQRSFHIVQNREPGKQGEALKHNRQVGGAIAAAACRATGRCPWWVGSSP